MIIDNNWYISRIYIHIYLYIFDSLFLFFNIIYNIILQLLIKKVKMKNNAFQLHFNFSKGFVFNIFFSINFCVNESNILRQKKYFWWFNCFEYTCTFKFCELMSSLKIKTLKGLCTFILNILYVVILTKYLIIIICIVHHVQIYRWFEWINWNWIEYRKPSVFTNFCLVHLYSEKPTLSYMTKKRVKSYSWLLNWSVQIFPECERKRKQSASSKRYITEWTLSTLKTNYILNAILT